MNPLHAYFPLLPGTFIDYAVFDIEGDPAKGGGFNPETGDYGITKQTDHPNSPQRISVSAVDYMRKLTYHTPTTPAPAAGSCLYEARAGKIIGEIGGNRVAQQPPIPLIIDGATPGTIAPYASNILHFGPDGEPCAMGVLNGRHWTMHVGKSWSSWPDTIRVSMTEENENPHPMVAYNYIFARGIGLVDFYRCLWDETTGALYSGHRYYAVARG